jgi:putative phosphoserine phosphatase/1-acylglycerol-3-phosphate O-acyltransferase
MDNIAAFFDMDKTIIWENTGLSSIRFAKEQGLISFNDLLKGAYKMLLYRLTILKLDEWYDNLVQGLAGLSSDDMERFSGPWFDEMVKKSVYLEAVEIMEHHRDQGHRVVLISNALSFIVHPMAAYLKIDDVICTKVEVNDDNRLTGRLIRPLCHGQGKLDYAKQWASDNTVDLEKSYFYTDSYYDLEMMEAVGRPVATNPDIRMMLAAKKNNWPILHFRRIPYEPA